MEEREISTSLNIGILEAYGESGSRHNSPRETPLAPSSGVVDLPHCLLSSCNRDIAIKTSTLVLSTGVFTITTYGIIKESQGSRNVKNLSLCALFNGASISTFCHMLFPPEHRKKINEWISAWTYEALLACSQIYLNLAPQEQMQLFTIPFVWSFGILEAKDILTLTSMDKSDLSLCTIPPRQEDLIRTVGFTTRDYSPASRLWLIGSLVAGIGLTTFNFVMRNQYSHFDDFGKIGLYQDLIALFSGSVTGDLIARIFDDQKEKIETKHSEQLIVQTETSRAIKVMRVAKTVFFLSTPLAIGTLLAIPVEANSLPDYVVKFSVGNVYGASQLVSRREFENRTSHFHSISLSPIMTQEMSTQQKVIAVAKKYLPSIAFFAVLTGYMSWAAATNSFQADYAIIVLLITTLFSFILTDVIAIHSRRQDNRILNELNFRLIYSSITLAIFFQYLTTKLDIGDEQLNSDSKSLYILSLITWFFWGINVGNNRALNLQPKNPSSLPISPPIATQELSKTFIKTL